MRAPVLLIGFNRPALAARVLERVVAARPSRLLLATDGPRAGHAEDESRCAEVRRLFDAVRLDGVIARDDAPSNLGCGVRIATAIDWALRLHDEVVVLEDDLLPEPSFFPYCDELLARYRDDERIGMVSGGNYQFGRVRGPHSYFFSHGVGTWGWATWRRAWRHFDFEMKGWPAARQEGMLHDVWRRPEIVEYWTSKLDEVAGGRADVWDYQWAFTLWRHRLLQVSPNRNLISCIGCGPDATHLTSADDPQCNMATEPIAFPLAHPGRCERDFAADLWEFHKIFRPLGADALAEAP